MSLSQGFFPIEADVTSAMFSEAVHALFGDGITDYGAQFAVTIGGFTVMVKSGYILADGRWVWYEDDEETHLLNVKMPSANKDRVDAVVCRVDYTARTAAIEIMVDVDEEAVTEDPSLVRGNGEYNSILYFIHIKRSATALTAEDITDVRGDRNLCGYIKPLKDLAPDVVTVYQYFARTVEEKFSYLSEVSKHYSESLDSALQHMENASNTSLQHLNAAVDSTLEKMDNTVDAALGRMENTVDSALEHMETESDASLQHMQNAVDSAADILEQRAGNYANVFQIGDLMTVYRCTLEIDGWLLCDGADVPETYGELYNMLSGKLPDISKTTDEYKTYIYGGVPQDD